MTKLSYVLTIETIQKPVTDLLRTAGFKKSGRTYNCVVGDGLIHVINFQMGQYPVGNYVVPGIRESKYGKFTVNVGVHLPCVSQIERGKIKKKFLREYDCEIRERLSTLAKHQDVWWSLDNSAQEIGKLIVSLLENFGLPFLSRYRNYVTVLSQYQAHGYLPFCNEGRSALVAAIICHHVGDLETATKLFDRATNSAIMASHSGFAGYVEKIRKLCVQ